MTYEEVMHAAFVDELSKIAAAAPLAFDLEKLSSAQTEYMLKQALIGAAIKKGLGGLKKALPSSGTSRLMGAAEKSGLGSTAQTALKKSKPSARMEQWGKTMRQTPVERVQAAGHKVAPREAAGITRAAQRMGGTSVGKRMVGGAAEGAGAHVAHKSALGLAINPLGVPMGGAIEGLTRQGGRELTAKGMTRAGGALQRHAGKAGLAGEIAGMAGLGTAVHAPLSGAGALGTAALKGIGLKGGLVNALGSYGAHGVADAVGTAMHSGAGKAVGRVAAGPVGAAARRVGGGVMRRLPGMVGAAA